MGDCVPTPTATQFATEADTTILQTTTLLDESTSVSVQTGSFPSTICAGSDGSKCSVHIITYQITSTSTTFVPIATSTVISQITNIIPHLTLFAPCTIDNPPSSPGAGKTSLSQLGVTPPNGGMSITSVYVTMDPSGQTQHNSNSSPNMNRAALIGGVISAVVTLSIIGFLMWVLWKKNRAMKAALAEHERKENEVNMAQFLPTPYPFTSSSPGPNVADTANTPTPQNPSSYSTHIHQQDILGLSDPPLSINPESSFATNEMYTHTRTNSIRLSTAGSQTHPMATFQPPGPSGVIASGQPPEHRRTSTGAEAKAREARTERGTSISDVRLRAVNITEGVEVDPANSPTTWSAPPPAYSRDTR